MKYLARHVSRSAISNSRIESVDEDGVTFRHKDYRDDFRQKSMTMSGEDFIGAFLIHVLPPGFQRIRFYGFLANSIRHRRLVLIYRLRNTVYAGDPVKLFPMPDLMKKLFGVEIDVCPCCRSPTTHARVSARYLDESLCSLTT